MQLPETLHKTVLAGTIRVSADPAASVAAALRALAGPGSQQLWHAVAAQDLWHRAGFEPTAGMAEPEPAEAGAECPRAAEDILLLLMRGVHAGLLPAWLKMAQARGVGLPHACLVPLLEQAMSKPDLRARLLPVLGARGRWLVAQNPEWASKFAAGTDDVAAMELAWNSGGLAQRMAVLRSMRSADPAAALAKLQSGWAQETADSRAGLLACLEVGLSLADEAFLEAALDDKRKEVRSTARELLSFLPGSQLSARCAARMDALISLEPGAGGKLPVLALTLPDACDKSMKRDGVGVDNPHRMGEKQCWMFNMMQCVPPQHWAQRWGVAPAGVLQMLENTDFGRILQQGLAHAIGLSARAGSPGAAEWFVAIHASKIQNAASISTGLAGMALALAHPERERVLCAWLESASAKGVAAALLLARQMAEEGASQLSPAASRLLLRNVQRTMQEQSVPDYGSKLDFGALAALLDISELEYLEQGWPAPQWAHWANLRQAVDELKEALRFRNTLQRSFMDDKD